MKILGCKIYRRGNKNSGKVAFTFDDGPHTKFTPLIMDTLEKHNSLGTFFSTGVNLEKNRSLAEEMAKRGHLLGNHTYSHPHALYTGRGKLRDEILRSKNLIEEITGSKNRIFRPPFGFLTPSLLSICRNLELSII
ncbi:MAG: polysaccharide deacetylase family protein, partial [candidate division Zixibacteria bacterium]|nr:polysaccharide deacetylase family protein [candidate division Zixibacteria bacterium]